MRWLLLLGSKYLKTHLYLILFGYTKTNMDIERAEKNSRKSTQDPLISLSVQFLIITDMIENR